MNVEYQYTIMGDNIYNIYTYMSPVYKPIRKVIDNYGKVNITEKQPIDFIHLLNKNINDIILFDNSTEDMKDEGRIILPKNYFLFIGNKDGIVQFKPYEFNKYRIVITTYKNIIISIDSIG